MVFAHYLGLLQVLNEYGPLLLPPACAKIQAYDF
jgi:hypothetical protein